ncbi:hypothetical protein OH807_02170 [Kitasatospora sp. NBC_01560]|uniref:hypothetical protein n=1 Tax=Kitasatospora sp. NBC_01560 TaxID=2975965 RepID=UPI0038639750
MNAGGDGGDGGAVGTGAVDEDASVWVGLGLAEAAAGARVGPVPVPEIMAGGRRLRRRRRTLVGAVALASAVVLAGGVTAGLRALPGGDGSVQVVAAAGPGSGPASGATSGASASAAASPAVRDPFTPVRTVLARGTVDGKEWKVWAALWPLAPKERAFEQARAVWQERSAVDPELAEPTAEYVQRYWQPDEDIVNVYFTVDGVRLGHDSEAAAPAPDRLPPGSDGQTTFGGGLLGHRGKDDTVAPFDVAVLALGPNVAKVVVTWTDGTTTEPTPVTVGDSPIRRLALARPDGKHAKSWQFFDANGGKLPDDGTKILE